MTSWTSRWAANAAATLAARAAPIPETSTSRSGFRSMTSSVSLPKWLTRRRASAGPTARLGADPRDDPRAEEALDADQGLGRAQLVGRDAELAPELAIVDPAAVQPQRQALADPDQLADDRHHGVVGGDQPRDRERRVVVAEHEPLD